MALDPNLPTRARTEQASPVIDNEIPAYRAVSGMAITSLLLGMLTAMTFIDSAFLLAGLGAIVFGVLARRKIHRMPDVLTGDKLAQVGIVLAVLLGLTATTHAEVDKFLTRQRINAFADLYLKELRSKSPDEVLWYHQHPDTRAAKTPEQVRDETLKAGQMAKMEYDRKVATVARLQKEVAAGAQLHREGLETSGYEGLTPYGAVLLEVHDSKLPATPSQTPFTLLEIKGERKAGRFKWWIGDLRADYKPKSYVHEEKPVDDGHGHGGGGGGGGHAH